jgi:outer membrane protein OmpA-like peptidoglycan-associated protein
MKTKLALLGAAAVLSLLSAQQSSAHRQGWYVGAEAGANWIADNDFTINNGGFSDAMIETIDWNPYNLSGEGTINFDTGWAGFVTFGYGFEKNWRVELEGGYRSNDFNAVADIHDVYGYERCAVKSFEWDYCSRTVAADGSFDEWTAMVNVIYDVPLSDKLDLNIGVGAGADFSRVKVGGYKDEDTNFAYQAIVGLTYKVTDRLDLTVNYRYLNVDSPSYSAEVGYTPVVANLEDVQKHTLTIGLRYDLYADEAPVVVAPPAPPPPPAAAEEPEQFVIFFGFDKCNITAEADAVLGEAASAAKSSGAVKVSIVGHTDTMGSDAYNKKLSECRANAARTNLVAKGISAASISASGHGESELLVKTQDNVKEPQNRRATIDLSK